MNRLGRISPAADLLDPIVEHFSKTLDKDPLALVNHTFFLPTRRSARSFLSKLASKAPHDAVVMPRVMALSEKPYIDLENDAFKIASKTERRLLMYSLLMQDRYKKQVMLCTSERQLFKFVDAVLLVVDELMLYDVSREHLNRLFLAELASHQMEALKLLQQIYSAWGNYLKEKGYQDPTEARILSYRAYIRHLHNSSHPVIAIGVQSQYGFVVDFLKALHAFPHGYVYYADSCSFLNDGGINKDRGHPQEHLLQLFRKIGVDLANIPYLFDHATTVRERFLERLFESHANDQITSSDTPLENIHCIETQNLFEEAEVVALLMAESAFTSDKTVALITSNQSLSSIVVGLLKRWSIIPDQSMGDPFKNSSLGRLLVLCAEFLIGDFSPTVWLSLLKHPYVSLGEGRSTVLSMTRLIENDVMRTQRLFLNDSDLLINTLPDAVRSTLESLINQKQAFQSRMKEKPTISFVSLIEEFKAFINSLVEGTRLEGYGSIFRTPEGQSFEAWLLDVEQSAMGTAPVYYKDGPEILRIFLADLHTTTAWGKHARVFVLGPLEARLLSFDRVVLADFNEGRWPRHRSSDVWLSESMKENLGMDGDRVSISQQADDFLAFLSQKEVFITRAKRVEGNPTIPSRWLMRLQSQLMRENKTLPKAEYYQLWAKQLWHQNQEIRKMDRPSANPPLNARPRRLSLSAIKRLKDNPYGFYMSDVLRLRPLHPLAHQLDAPRFGALLHAVLASDLISRHSGEPPSQSILEQATRRIFFPYRTHPLWRFYWKNRLDEALSFYNALEAQQDRVADRMLAEITLSSTFKYSCGPFELIAKADRIDLMKDGSVRIIDYKTGKCPSLSEISRFDDMQLVLEGLMIQQEALNVYDVSDVYALQYWDLKTGKCIDIPDVKSLIRNAADEIETLLLQYYEAGGPYDLVLKHLYEDVRHFSRWDEWTQGQMDVKKKQGAPL